MRPVRSWVGPAFQNYLPGRPIIGPGVRWVGLKHFIKFIDGHYFWRLIRNTFLLSFYSLIFGFPIPIIFAIAITQLRARRFAKCARRTPSWMASSFGNENFASNCLRFTDEISKRSAMP